ncbi:MAG: coniferyl aldehyde dehydrogenase [Alphaproteobacteria bacterium]|nr:coniferyl aldehyde dehydrogenase [Alphaproteobacteria bacterium]
MNRPIQPSIEETKARMGAILELQKRLQTGNGAPDVRLRKDRLTRAVNLVLAHKDEFLSALNEDFGARSRDMSLFTDLSGAVGPLKHARAHVEKWMAPQKRSVTPSALGLFGARAEVRYQPKGVVGVISPWNFPISLSFDAIAGAFAAGNRVMLKLSEHTPATSALMAQTIDLYFDEDELAVINGGPEVGAAFAGLAFDHLIFTGATTVGRHVMRAAADNLVPVTLELGGKSPVVISKSADLTKTAARVMTGKTMNAGQICLAPDYVLAPKESIPEFVAQSKAAVAKMYPTLKDNADYTAVINQRHYERITGLIADAKAKGGEIVTINPANEDFSQQEHRKIPPTLILNATDDMQVMQEEIFVPVLPVRTVESVDAAISEINARPRPLALYYFGDDADETEALLNRTHSGGVTINDVIFHFAMDDLPFGGVGPSGMGAYHGHRGFVEFSHEKAIYRQISAELLAMLRPPYGATFRKQMAARLKP